MGSMMKAASGELELMERIKTLHEELDDLTAQLEQAKEQISQLNSQQSFYTKIPAGITRIADLPWGIYSLAGSQLRALIDNPIPSSGRAIVITSGSNSNDEKVALIMSSNHPNLYYGHAFGITSIVWEEK